jgi:Fur family transcriptional regulator, ferric uptake regulator
MDREVPSPSLVVRGWDEQLRARGYRVTPQRQLVLEAVARLDHGTPEEIGAEVQQTARGVNISTIYRTLELLEQIGMVTHNHLRHGAPTYHLATDADHVHLKCRVCGRVTEVGPDAIRPLITALEERHGFETDVGHLTVFGRCQECRAQMSEPISREPKGAGADWTEERGTSDEGRRRLKGRPEASGKAESADA